MRRVCEAYVDHKIKGEQSLKSLLKLISSKTGPKNLLGIPVERPKCLLPEYMRFTSRRYLVVEKSLL